MADDNELKIKITAELAQVKKSLSELQRSLRETGDAGKSGGGQAASGLDGITEKAKSAQAAVKKLVGVYASFATARKLISAADEMQALDASLKLATKSEREYGRAREETFRIAQATGQEIGSTIGLYTDLSRSTQALGVDQGSLLRVMETVQKTMVIGRSSAAASSAAMLQFGQAMAMPKFRAQELNSIISQTPELARAIERGLGIQQGTLRKYADEVGLTARAALDALMNVSDTIDAEFASIPRTVGQAVTALQNEFMRLAGGVELDSLVASIENIREVIADPAFAAGVRGIASVFITGFNLAANAVRGLGMALDLLTNHGETIVRDINSLDEAITRLEQAKAVALKAGRDTAALDMQLNALREKLKELTARWREMQQAKEDALAADAAADEQQRRLAQAAAQMAEADQILAELSEKARKEGAARAKQIESLITNLQREAATVGKTAAEIVQYTLAQLGASAATRRQAAALSAQIAARQKQLELEKKAQEAEEARQKRLEQIPQDLMQVWIEIQRITGNSAAAVSMELSQRYKQLIEDLKSTGDQAGVEIVESLINLQVADARLAELRAKIQAVAGEFDRTEQSAANRVATGTSPGAAREEVRTAAEQSLQRLQAYRTELEKLATEGAPGAAEALAQLDQTMSRIGSQSATGLQRAIQDLRLEVAQMMADFSGTAAMSFRDSLAQFLTDLSSRSKNAKEAIKDFARGFAQAMMEVAARALATMAVLKMLEAFGFAAGGGGGSFMSALIKHDGGQVGAGGKRRAVPAWIFAGAARYHAGGFAGSSPLKPGEVPAILKAGEEVITQADPRHALNGGGAGASGPRNIRIVLTDDRANIGDYLTSSEGDAVYLEQAERNVMGLRSILGL